MTWAGISIHHANPPIRRWVRRTGVGRVEGAMRPFFPFHGSGSSVSGRSPASPEGAPIGPVGLVSRWRERTRGLTFWNNPSRFVGSEQRAPLTLFEGIHTVSPRTGV